MYLSEVEHPKGVQNRIFKS